MCVLPISPPQVLLRWPTFVSCVSGEPFGCIYSRDQSSAGHFLLTDRRVPPQAQAPADQHKLRMRRWEVSGAVLQRRNVPILGGCSPLSGHTSCCTMRDELGSMAGRIYKDRLADHLVYTPTSVWGVARRLYTSLYAQIECFGSLSGSWSSHPSPMRHIVLGSSAFDARRLTRWC